MEPFLKNDFAMQSKADIFFLKAMRYEELYVNAQECFSKAQSLDPTWDEPKEKSITLVRIC